MWFVEVEHREVAQVWLEQSGFGLKVAGHIVVIVEMIPAQIREHCHPESGAIHTMEVQRVRRNFHGHRYSAFVAKLRQPLL